MRRAAGDDRALVVDLIARAFQADPTWSWAFPDPATRLDAHREWWGVFVGAALAHHWVWLADDDASASVWIPPGATELEEEDEQKLEGIAQRWCGSEHAAAVLALVDQFDEHHPHDPPHYYLSLLGTDPQKRGRGTGLGLLAENLALIDSERESAYLEASNSDNVPLYERFGFATRSQFSVPGSPEVTTMWRDPR